MAASRLNPLVVARLKLLSAALIGVATFLLLPEKLAMTMRALTAWDASAFLYLAMVAWLAARGTPETMKRRAAIQDLGRWAILAILAGGACFSVLALIFIGQHAKAASEPKTLAYLGVMGTTIILSWTLLHTMFALHYAHDYYGPADDPEDEDGLVGGLEFPSEPQPDYWDFLYFSFVVGMTCQVSDVQISERGIRRLALVHGVVAFFFNTIILALTINIVAGLL